jgi:hypothetical protein
MLPEDGGLEGKMFTKSAKSIRSYTHRQTGKQAMALE